MGPTPESLLDQISDPQHKKSEHLFGPASQENHDLVGHLDIDNNQQDEMDDIIDSFFADPDVCSPGETDVAVSDHLESANQVIRQHLAWIFYLMHSVINHYRMLQWASTIA
jgi:hypothetical protein